MFNIEPVKNTTIELDYDPRPQQELLHDKLEKHRFAVLNCHRRFGKTVAILNHLIRSALNHPLPNPRFAYIAPTYKQAKNVAWDYIKQFTASIPGVRYNETELRCDLPNGSRITLLSSENPDSLRGIFLDGVCIDEAAQIAPKLWNEIIRPALSDRKGFCYFIGTPAGMNNFFYDIYQYALKDPEWLTFTAPVSETKLIDEKELQAAKDQMGEAKYKQEFECDWIANIEGSIYGNLIADSEKNNRLTKIEYDPALPVDTAWDLGHADSTAIIFFQKLGNTIRIIDYYENNREGLPHYISLLNKKDYVYGKHYAPHDIEVTEFSTGKTRREVAYQLGVNFKILPKLPIEDGIHAAKMLLPRCYFSLDNTRPLIDALRHYHRRYNEKMKMYHEKPIHDWSSHACDAFRYLAIAIEELPSNTNLNKLFPKTDSEYSIHGR
jgi:hypothetical protein